MKLSAPKNATWFVALIAGALGVAMHYRLLHVAVLSPYAVFLLTAAWALLVVATFVRGL